ncbi:adenosylcobinamide-phosphate synthase CbiB [Pyrococcus abyssi]|uniref:Probable cobalamin biosynthesis protein CobD n=1 Tax=Pyrococcus abyssi (strain GE5 / Orsay) TaxID=272844 RepID=COBD_PYRAB|nr:adenosylcobinamide-phosphate synthase CbiB [Pyrococcus abyssi]Q9V2M8.1 RecName: Full=Probable cobalamin biosynthesis protein CobD [Pyrococcus abyssi GE5]CAB48970.1 cbiB cobalamin biosynthesis protein B [Pyrococcus abyssi GE5]CCE69419.1 TPA: cobalamin biosynthesis protein [Pyrococcus abyssi GE5]
MNPLILLGLALIWDLLLGEPPAKIHPVVWFGKIAGFLDNRWRRRGKIGFLAGAFVTFIIVALAFFLSLIPSYLTFPLDYLLAIYLLKSSFAIRSLYEHVARTVTEDIEEKRKTVSMIVSRDVKVLDLAHLNSAAIESLAENLNDSVVAPLFYFMLFGLPGAMVYRAVNTLDAMFGYRDERYEYFGKFPARLDDILNFIPARLTVLLYLPFGVKVLKYYKLARFKINSDKPIAAMSAVLGVWLEKPGAYRFPGREPRDEDIKRALDVYKLVVAEYLSIVFVLKVVQLCLNP